MISSIVLYIDRTTLFFLKFIYQNESIPISFLSSNIHFITNLLMEKKKIFKYMT